ncbi:MAG: precorrin-6y C5,15-methyltransferase (decarboxylating) subunit CbiE [Bacillota bacterium]|nr:precorrin-6y C5,15-methyltransferase (decarboxylating) subunit CbiE [Bacillota bacterium]
MAKVYVIGMGVSNYEYRLPRAENLILTADTLIGAKRHLDGLDMVDKQQVYLENGFDDAIEYIKKFYEQEQICILVSGDPGFHSFLGYLKRNLSNIPIEVIPGISSIQVFFARLEMMWHDAAIVSLHGRKTDIAMLAKSSEKLCVLTDGLVTPSVIAKELIEAGIDKKIMAIGERLGYEDEKISKMRLAEAIDYDADPLNVVVIYDEDIQI